MADKSEKKLTIGTFVCDSKVQVLKYIDFLESSKFFGHFDITFKEGNITVCRAEKVWYPNESIDKF